MQAAARREWTAGEIAPALGLSERAVRLRASRENWRCMHTRVRGGLRQVFLWGGLPDEVRARLAADSTLPVPHDPAPVPELSPEPGPLVPDKARDGGLAKYLLVKKFRAAVDAAGWGKKRHEAAAFVLAYNSGRLMPEVFATLGEMAENTLRALDKRLREAGDDYHAIADGRGGWRKHGTTRHRGRIVRPETQQAILQCWLNPRQPGYEAAVRGADFILERADIFDPCSKTTRIRWLKDWAEEPQNAPIVTLAREGRAAYIKKWGRYITRDSSLLTPGQVLVADGKKLNFLVRHPDTGKPCRMALIVFYDWASRDPVGWQIMPTEDTVAIQAALFNAIVAIGRIPEAVYLDNGKAFKARIFTETDPDLEQLTGLYARLGIVPVFAKPYNARSKVVERFFLTMQEQLECLMPSFIGDSIDNKPAWMLRNEKFHKAWHAAMTAGWVPTVRDAAHFISVYFEWFRNQPHGGLGGRRPIEVMQAGRGPGVDVSALRHEFLWRRPAQVRRCRIRMWGIDYEGDCLHGRRGCVAYINTADLSLIHCYDDAGRYLGDVTPVQALQPVARLFGDEVSIDQVARANAAQRRDLRRVQKGLAALNVGADLIEALPYGPKVAVIPGGKKDTPQLAAPEEKPERMSRDERRRLETVYERAAAAPEPPAVERPAYFEGELERYEWCFRTRYQHETTLDSEDEAFMTYYEQTREYLEHFADRFEQLRQFYGG